MSDVLRTSGRAKIRLIAREDNFLFTYRERLKKLIVEIHALYRRQRDGPWFIMTGILPKTIWLNRKKYKKGDKLWFRRVNIELLSLN